MRLLSAEVVLSSKVLLFAVCTTGAALSLHHPQAAVLQTQWETSGSAAGKASAQYEVILPNKRGFAATARLRDDARMEGFIESFVRTRRGTIIDRDALKNIVPYYSGTLAWNSFDHLVAALSSENFVENFSTKAAKAFEDVTRNAFPQEWYSWEHSGFPRSHQGTPTFVDLDGNGILDYFYHNHYEAEPATAWDIGLSTGNNTRRSGEAFFRSVGAELVTCTEPNESKWKEEAGIDSHGTAILDVDRDGYLDIYIAVGGGDGLVAGPAKNAVLMWGSKGENGLPHFTGGRDASEAAGVENKDSRGRFNYWADFNQDGLLDVVFSNEPRDDEVHAYGYMMINGGNRSFVRHDKMKMYSETMILTDADGDGRAEEFIVQHRDCGWKRCKYSNDEYCMDLQKRDRDWWDFCSDRPEGTSSIYKWSDSKQDMDEISTPAPSFKIGAPEHGMSMQTGDFDGDQLADLVVLFPTSLQFFYSSHRQKGELPGASPGEILAWSSDDCVGSALRIADLDLNGQQELLIQCFTVKDGQPPSHRLYTGKKDYWTLNEDVDWLGDLYNTTAVHPALSQMEGACDGVLTTYPGFLRKGCEEFIRPDEYDGGHYKTARSMGMSVVDWNNDGFMDIALSYDFGNMLMMRNNFAFATDSSRNRFLAIKLKGTKSNVYGVGATLLLEVSNMGDEQDDTVTMFREVNTASHETDWFGTKDDRIVFGLGSTGTPSRLTIKWPVTRKWQFIEMSDMIGHLNSMTDLLVVTEPESSE